MLDNSLQIDSELTEDESLMLAYSQGNAKAFDLLYARHKSVIYRFFIRQNVTVSIAEELCHDTWIKVIDARQSYQVSALFKTYLFTIARRTFIDYQRKKSTLNEVTIESEGEIEIETKDPNIQNRKLGIALAEEIADLPFDQREVFVLKQESGFTIDEIAQITSLNKEKVKSSWRYALKRLRKGLSFYV